MNDQTYLIFFRLLHVTCGVFWAGSVFYLALFIIPAVKKSGPEGTKFMQQLGKTGYPIVIMIIAIITILSGFMILRKLSNGFESIWFTTLYAKVLSIGMGTTLVAFIIGFTVSRPAAMHINRISDAIAKAGGLPTNEQMQELLALRNKIFTATNYIAILLFITVISMSIFRYVS